MESIRGPNPHGGVSPGNHQVEARLISLHAAYVVTLEIRRDSPRDTTCTPRFSMRESRFSLEDPIWLEALILTDVDAHSCPSTAWFTPRTSLIIIFHPPLSYILNHQIEGRGEERRMA